MVSSRFLTVAAVAMITALGTGPPLFAETREDHKLDITTAAVPVPVTELAIATPAADIAAPSTLTASVDDTKHTLAIAPGSLPPPNKDSPPFNTANDFLYGFDNARHAMAHLALRPGSDNASPEVRPRRFLDEDAFG